MLIIAASGQIKEGRRGFVIQHLLQLQAASRTEVGCLTYRFYNQVDDPDKIFLYEEWESPEAHAAHRETEHFKLFSENLPDWITDWTVKRLTAQEGTS